VPVTDMGATGSSAFYYDFDSFQEMAVTTGGADASNATGGVQLNMILRKGNNKASGNARVYFENQDLQAIRGHRVARRQRGIEKAPSPGIQPKRFEALIVERRVTASFRRVPSSAVHVFVGNEGLGQRLRTIDVHHRSPARPHARF